jgi:hypothetical protein
VIAVTDFRDLVHTTYAYLRPGTPSGIAGR